MATATAQRRETGSYAYLALLGLRIFALTDLLRAIERGLPFQAFERLQRHVGLEIEQIAALIHIPRRTLTRRREQGRFLPEESDRLVTAARLLGKALDLFEGDADATRRWLQSRHKALGGAVALDVAKTEVGAREVETLIDQLEQGIFP
jgi:putative toxin-antitoxin system antitoxin component (TIGR02293 family)